MQVYERNLHGRTKDWKHCGASSTLSRMKSAALCPRHSRQCSRRQGVSVVSSSFRFPWLAPREPTRHGGDVTVVDFRTVHVRFRPFVRLDQWDQRDPSRNVPPKRSAGSHRSLQVRRFENASLVTISRRPENARRIWVPVELHSGRRVRAQWRGRRLCELEIPNDTESGEVLTESAVKQWEETEEKAGDD